MSAIIECNNDKDGIIWPKNIAPFEVLVLPVQSQDKKVFSLAQNYYQELKKEGLKVLLDDRAESAGIKFKDADLIGIPLRITIGDKNLKNGKVEIKERWSGKVLTVGKDSVLEKIKLLVKEIN
jgi:prolyl-tRNA synthetase